MKKNTSDSMTFGQRLAYTRKKKGLTQKQLAELAGVDNSSISHLENGTQDSSTAMIRKITKALEVSEDWFKNDDNFSIAEKQQYSKLVKKLTKEQQQLVADNEWVIGAVYHNNFKSYHSPENYEYVYGYAAIALCRAAKAYDKLRNKNTSFSGRKISFSSFSYQNVLWAINRALKKIQSKNDFLETSDQAFISLNQQIDEDGDRELELESAISAPDEWEPLEYKILAESVYQKVEPVLTANEKETFRFWLHGMKDCEIAKAIGVTAPTVRYRIMQAENKCKALFTPDDLFS